MWISSSRRSPASSGPSREAAHVVTTAISRTPQKFGNPKQSCLRVHRLRNSSLQLQQHQQNQSNSTLEALVYLLTCIAVPNPHRLIFAASVQSSRLYILCHLIVRISRSPVLLILLIDQNFRAVLASPLIPANIHNVTYLFTERSRMLISSFLAIVHRSPVMSGPLMFVARQKS